MPFEPLRTDEPIERHAVRKVRDFESSLMAGCATIVLASLITYFLSIWPFFVFPEYRISGLLIIALAGPGTAGVFGIFCTRKFGLAGASGFVGGAMASAIFMFLRLQQTVAVRGHHDYVQPEYPDRWAWLTPLAWFLISGALALIFLPKEPEEHLEARPIDRE